MDRYNKLNNWLKTKFSEKVLKICVDGGFTCPNRDGKCGYGGCIFCGAKGSGENIKYKDIRKQVESFLSSYRGERANKFIVYFQNFTNTYDKVENLKKVYDSALISDKIIGLSIATRPDCIDEEIAKLINSYQNKYYVSVELGLQSSSNKTAKIINRGYKTKIFVQAVKILKKYNIPIVTHIMIGLPFENNKNVIKTIKFLNKNKIDGIKIHSTYVLKNTKLQDLYIKGLYNSISLEEYINTTCIALSYLNPNIVIHRLSGDAPKEYLIAPEWNLHKKWVLNGIEKYLNNNNLYQGKYFKVR